jgi:hypothetical protein
MSAANPLLPQPKPHEPSMEEILASIRRIIADDQALSASQGGPPNGEALTPAARTGAGRTLVSNGQDSSVRAAFNTLLPARVMSLLALPAKCCVPCSKLGLTTICRPSWNVLSPLRSSGSRAANKQGAKPAARLPLPRFAAARGPGCPRTLAFCPLVCHRSRRVRLAPPGLA